MGTSDGSVLGTTKIVDNGPATRRYNIVILSEGYRSSEMTQFAADAQQFANTLFATAPYYNVRTAINIHRVDVTSTDSGAADPVACGGTGENLRTYFDASFCNNGIKRLLEVNNTTVLSAVAPSSAVAHGLGHCQDPDLRRIGWCGRHLFQGPRCNGDRSARNGSHGVWLFR